MPNGDDSGDQNQCSSDQNYSSADQNMSSVPQDSTQDPVGISSLDSLQPDSSNSDSSNMSPATSGATMAGGGIATALAAPKLYTPADPQPYDPPPSGQPANDNAEPEFDPDQPANDNAEPESEPEIEPEPEGVEGVGESVTEGAELTTEGVETGELITEGVEVTEVAVEGGEILLGGEIVAGLLAPEIVIPLLIIVAICASDDPVPANSAGNQQSNEDVDESVTQCTDPNASTSPNYLPVIPDQKYTDQTCTDAVREAIHAQLEAIKDQRAQLGRLPQIPKKGYNQQLAEAPDDKVKNSILRKQQVLCGKLNEALSLAKELLRIRNLMQSECFNSPKNTQDEKDRDVEHQKQVKGLNNQIKELLKAIKNNC